MKKSIFLFLAVLLSLSSVSQIRMGSCDPSSDRNTLYLTFYTGYGFGNYRLKHSAFSSIINSKLNQFDLGASLHLKLNNSKIGIGADYNQLKNDFNNLSIVDNKTILYNIYLNYEYNLYSDLFFDFGLFVGAGYPISTGFFGGNNLEKYPFSLHTGLFANFIINSYSAIVVRAKYNVFFAKNDLLTNNLEHQMGATLAEIGYRMWFNF